MELNKDSRIAIRKELLHDEIIYKEYLNTTDQVNYANEIVIKNVRVQFDKHWHYDNGLGKAYATEDNFITIDALNSEFGGNPEIFKPASIIKYGESKFTVDNVLFIRQENGLLHHIEVEVK